MFTFKKAAGILCAAAIALAVLLPFLPSAKTPTPAPGMHSAAAAGTQRSTAVPRLTLFPELNPSHITTLSVSTPERSFQFHLSPHGTVSVNGHRADRDIVSVLLNQISGLPVETHSAFSPSAADLLLTLIISTGTQKKTARFYSSGSPGETARIVLDTNNTREYRQTNTWRVGTLMMTCEGTRIQDMHGNEWPVTLAE